MKIVIRLERLSDEERLRELGLVSLEERSLGGSYMYKYMYLICINT